MCSSVAKVVHETNFDCLNLSSCRKVDTSAVFRKQLLELINHYWQPQSQTLNLYQYSLLGF